MYRPTTEKHSNWNSLCNEQKGIRSSYDYPERSSLEVEVIVFWCEFIAMAWLVRQILRSHGLKTFQRRRKFDLPENHGNQLSKSCYWKLFYCGGMYPDVPETSVGSFDQPQTVIRAYLDNLLNYPNVKKLNSDGIGNYATFNSSFFISSLFAYESDLWSAPKGKWPSIKKEGWSFQTVKRSLLLPTLNDFNWWQRYNNWTSSENVSDSEKTERGQNAFPKCKGNYIESVCLTFSAKHTCNSWLESQQLTQPYAGRWSVPRFTKKLHSDIWNDCIYRLMWISLNRRLFLTLTILSPKFRTRQSWGKQPRLWLDYIFSARL